jgi:hypothetical protein
MGFPDASGEARSASGPRWLPRSHAKGRPHRAGETLREGDRQAPRRRRRTVAPARPCGSPPGPSRDCWCGAVAELRSRWPPAGALRVRATAVRSWCVGRSHAPTGLARYVAELLLALILLSQRAEQLQLPQHRVMPLTDHRQSLCTRRSARERQAENRGTTEHAAPGARSPAPTVQGASGNTVENSRATTGGPSGGRRTITRHAIPQDHQERGGRDGRQGRRPWRPPNSRRGE